MSVTVLVAIAAVGSAIGRDKTSEPSNEQAGEAPTPAASLTATPVPAASEAATAISTPSPKATQTAHTPQAASETAPTEPSLYAFLREIGSTTVATDEHGVWTSDDAGETWALTPMQHDNQQGRCITTTSDTLAFVHNPHDGPATLSVFDPAVPGWIDDGATSLPTFPETESPRSNHFCSGTVTADDRLTFSTAVDGAVVFAIQQPDGSFQSRRVSLPDDWTYGSTPDSVGARTLRNGDSVVITYCGYYIDTGCLTSFLQLDEKVLAPGGSTEMTWAQAGGAVVLPSENGVATVYADLGGSIDSGFQLIQVGDEAWAIELTQELGYNRGPDFTSPVGRWAVGPVGSTPVPLGIGYWPILSWFDGGVIASMVKLGEPSGDGPWGSSLDDDEVDGDAGVDRQWWSFERTTNRWVQLDEDPRPPAIPQPEPFRSPPLTWVSTTDRQAENEATPSETRAWDEVVASGKIMIAGDHAFVDSANALWSSDDRGVSWSEQQPRQWTSEQGLCGAVTDVGFAYISKAWDNPATLNIVSADSTEQIVWPVAPRLFLGDRGFGVCRPLRLDKQWWTAEVTHDLTTLHLTSTSDGQRFDIYSVDLTGQWSDAIPGGTTRGAAHLYFDDGWFVVRLCRSGDGYVCSQAVDLRLNANLLQADRSEGDVVGAADLQMPEPTTASGISNKLHQVGDQLWSVELNTVAGSVGEHGGDAGVGRYGAQPERVDGTFADVRLRYGKVVRCAYSNQDSSGLPSLCEEYATDGSWQPILGTIAVDWATVPTGTSVSFFYRNDDGQILVIPS